MFKNHHSRYDEQSQVWQYVMFGLLALAVIFLAVVALNS